MDRCWNDIAECQGGPREVFTALTSHSNGGRVAGEIYFVRLIKNIDLVKSLPKKVRTDALLP